MTKHVRISSKMYVCGKYKFRISCLLIGMFDIKEALFKNEVPQKPITNVEDYFNNPFGYMEDINNVYSDIDTNVNSNTNSIEFDSYF